MNSTLEQTIHQADGRYFSDAELKTLERYVQTYSLRLKTYALICEKGNEMVQRSLQILAQTDAQTVQQYKDKCVRDMTFVLQALATAILRDDEEGFRQQLVLWMQNIMAALDKEDQSARAYRMLQEEVRATMPADYAALVNHYLELFIDALLMGAQ
jgi:hypothetical protein